MEFGHPVLLARTASLSAVDAPTDESTAGRPAWRWYDTVVAMVGGLVAAIFVGGLLAAAIFGVDGGTIDPAAGFWVIVPIQAAGLLLTLKWIAGKRATGNLGLDIGLSAKPTDIVWLLAGPAAAMILGFVALAAQNLLGIEGDNPQAVVETARAFAGTSTAIAVLIGVAILAPLSEESVFRGLLLRTALSKGLTPMSATIISAAVFAGFHAALDPSLWQTAEGVLTTTLLFLLGVGLARLAIHFKRLGPSIFVHSGFNLTTLVLLFFFPDLA